MKKIVIEIEEGTLDWIDRSVQSRRSKEELISRDEMINRMLMEMMRQATSGNPNACLGLRLARVEYKMKSQVQPQSRLCNI